MSQELKRMLEEYQQVLEDGREVIEYETQKALALNEPILPNDYPVHLDYAYVCDGEVTLCPFFGDDEFQPTVAYMKANLPCNEVRRCDLKGRGLL